MRISSDVTGLDEVIGYLGNLDGKMTNEAIAVVRETSEDVQVDIQSVMPVDTGWAQMRWGEPLYGGIWRIDTDQLGITQGSSVEPYEYIEKLNEGSSLQAPAGFIDTAAERGRLKLEANLERGMTEATQ